MRLPKSTKSRVWLAVGAVAALAVIAFGITAYNLWQDGNAPSASDSKDGKSTIPDGPTGYPTFAGPSIPSTGAKNSASGAGVFGGKAGIGPFATSSGGDTRMYSVTISIKSDGAAYVGYRYRDGKGSDLKVINRTYSFTRSVRGPLPIAQVGVQVLSNATYATCSIAIDGTTTTSNTARGDHHVVVCLS